LGFNKTQRGLDLPKHQSYLAIHLALCDNTKPHWQPAAEEHFAEALNDARAAGAEMERARVIAKLDKYPLNELVPPGTEHSQSVWTAGFVAGVEVMRKKIRAVKQ